MDRKSQSVLSGDLKMNSEGLASGTTGRWDCQVYPVDVKQPTNNQAWDIEAVIEIDRSCHNIIKRKIL